MEHRCFAEFCRECEELVSSCEHVNGDPDTYVAGWTICGRCKAKVGTAEGRPPKHKPTGPGRPRKHTPVHSEEPIHG